jgi:EAL domain-containing protein (putative c-di-GMP-specific phosphodiesterase class I)
LDRILAITGLPGESLVVEITESVWIDQLTATCHLLQQLRNRSIGISIDDFGTGYLSFGSLHYLPIINLKIDRSFIGRRVDSCRNPDIVRTIIMLAHQLRVKANAEGIETVDQRHLLETLDCDLGQGYLFDRPLPMEDLHRCLMKAVVIPWG